VEAGHGRDIPVSVCGEMAGDVLCAPVLLGLGVDELSMRPAVIPRIKRLLRHSDTGMLRELGARVLRCEDSERVRGYLERTLPHTYPQEFEQL
jgi:phosphotransferase system enzyme I (PtsI)